MSESSSKFDLFALVELFGHQKIAGKVTEQSVGSASFIRVDVPETDQVPAFTRFFNPSAIYAINPMTEDAVLVIAKQIQISPIQAWDVRKMHEKILALNAGDNES